jgi:uncharacterized spore protein YtfJ
MEPPEALNHLALAPERANASSCFGTPVTAGDRTVIPVAEVTYGVGLGFGGGSGDSPDETGAGSGGAGGAGGRARGVAVIEVGPEGTRVLPVHDQTAITLAGLSFAGAATAIASRTLLKLIRG